MTSPISTPSKLSFSIFQDRYQRLAQPFEWRFTRDDLVCLLSRLNATDTLPLSA